MTTRTRRFVAGTAAAIGLALALSLGACSSGADEHVNATEFAEAVQQRGTVLLDVRTSDEFAGGHLPGALNIDVEGGDFEQRIAGLDKSAAYALYCHSGRRSAIALDKMKEAGFTNVRDLAGGIGAWTEAGGAVTTR